MIVKIKEGLKKLFSTGFFHVFGSSVINKMLGFLCGIVLVRVISKAEYGIYTYANNIYSFFLLACGFGMTSAVLQVCSEKNDTELKKNVYETGCFYGNVANIIIAIAVVVTAVAFKLPIDGSNEFLLLMCLLSFFEFVPEMQRTYMRSSLLSKEYSFSTTIATVLHVVLVCGLSYFFKSKGLIAGTYLTFLFSYIVNNKLFNVKYHFKSSAKTVSKEDKRSLLKIGGISMVNNGLSKLMYMLDIFVLGLFFSDETIIASYKIATYIPNALLFIPASIIVYVYPHFAQKRFERAWLLKNYKLLFLGTLVLCSLISVVLFIGAEPIIKIVFGEQYLDAVTSFRILVISFVFSSALRTLAGNILVTQRKLMFNMIIAVLSSLLNTALNVILIKNYASDGAAFATLITGVVSGIISTIYLIHVLKSVKPNTEEVNNKDIFNRGEKI